jgi:hypothetical protein
MSPFVLLLSSELSTDLPADAGSICDNAAVLGDTIKETPSNFNY